MFQMRIFVLQGDSGSSRTFAKTRRDPAGVRNLGGHVVRGRRQSGGEAMQSHSAGGPSPSAVPTGSPGPAGSGSYYLGGGHILQRAPDEIWGPVPQKRMHTSHTTAGVHGSPARMKLQYFGHLMQRVDSLEKTLMLGGIGGRAQHLIFPQ